MSTDKSRFVVSADWVEKQLGTAGFRLVDASWYLPAHKRNGAEEFAAGHLPGAVFFDQDKIADHATGLPHSLPSPEFFAEQAGELGLSDTDTIVVYDGPGFFSAPRVWWMLRVMGVRKAYVLDGGLDGWKREGRPLETGTPEIEPATFTPDFNEKRVTSLSTMRGIVDSGEKQIADARGADVSPATRPSRVPACVRAICPALAACPPPHFPRTVNSRTSPPSARW